MTTLTHTQARQFLLAAADGLLVEADQEILTEHLRACAECQGYQAELTTLENRLQAACRQHRETAPSPQRVPVPNLQAQHRRNVMNARLASTLKFAFGSALLAGLVILLVTSLRNVKNLPGTPTPLPAQQTASPSQTPVAELPVRPAERLVAFASTQEGNSEIYVLKTDGSQAVNLTQNPAYDGNPLWSPDGNRLAFESDRDGNHNIYVMNVDGSGLQQLTRGTGNNVLGNWSPDGSYLYFFNDRQGYWLLYTLKADGSAVTQITDTPTERETYLWSPTGEQIAYYVGGDINNRNQIEVSNVDGTQQRKVATRDPAQGDTAWQYARIVGWSPDGQFLYYAYETGDGNWFVLKAATDGSMNSQKIASGYALSTGNLVTGWVGSDSTFYSIRQATGSSYGYTWQNQQTGKPKLWDPYAICQINPNNYVGKYPISAWEASREGSLSLLGVSCPNLGFSRLYRLDLTNSALTQIAEFPTVWSEASFNWSADDQQALVQARNQATGNWEVYFLHELANTQPKISDLSLDGQVVNLRLQPIPYTDAVLQAQVTPEPPPTSAPLWTGPSADDLIAFTSNANGTSNLYLAKNDGSQITHLTNRSTGDSDPLWSPDGNWIAFASSQNANYALHIIRPDGNDERKLIKEWWEYAWSPDSQKIAYLVRLPDTPPDPYSPAKISIRIIDLDGKILQDTFVGSFNQAGQINWSRDGQAVSYVVTLMKTTLTGEMQTITSNLYQLKLGSDSPTTLITSDKLIDSWIETGSKILYLVRDSNQWDLFENQGRKLATWSFDQIQCNTGTDHPSLFSSNYGAEAATKRWSPDGKYLAFELTCDDYFTWLYLGTRDGKFVKLVDHPISNGAYGQSPSWSPDGEKIVFAADLEMTGNTDLYTLDVKTFLKDASTQPTRLITSGFGEYSPAWQPQP